MKFSFPVQDSLYIIEVDGAAQGSDIKLNNFYGNVTIWFREEKLLCCSARPFTHNCGAKAIENLWIRSLPVDDRHHPKRALFLLESFLWSCCNTGIIVGSDYSEGTTLRNIRNYGVNYEMSQEVPNPNYIVTHMIRLFYKNLLFTDGYLGLWAEDLKKLR